MSSKIQIRCIKLENNKFMIDTTDPNYTIFQTQVHLIEEAMSKQLSQFYQHQQPRFIYQPQPCPQSGRLSLESEIRTLQIHNLEYLNIDKDTELPEN